VAGRIDAVGRGVTAGTGARVMSLVPGAGYAEAVVVHAREAMAVPDAWFDEEAGGAPEAYLTAFDALFTRGHLQPGERVLVTAVGSGVGLAVVQLAKAAGCRVHGTSRTASKLAAIPELDSGSIPGEALPEVDVVIDLVGGPGAEACLRALATRGRYVGVGLLGGASLTLPLGLLLTRRLRLEGTVLRSRPVEEKIALAQAFVARGLPLLGARRPRIDRVYPATEAADAHRRMESNAGVGRIVLRW
jgi:NADPH:quinone reductase-like Zn-dependent oxidoreductase